MGASRAGGSCGDDFGPTCGSCPPGAQRLLRGAALILVLEDLESLCGREPVPLVGRICMRSQAHNYTSCKSQFFSVLYMHKSL